MPSELLSAAARAMNKARKNTTNAGRKRSDKPRCNCGAMTAKRAKTRGHHC